MIPLDLQVFARYLPFYKQGDNQVFRFVSCTFLQFIAYSFHNALKDMENQLLPQE